MINIYGADRCPWCVKAKRLCDDMGVEYQYQDIGATPSLREYISSKGLKTIPQCFDDETHIGGYERLFDYLNAQ